LLGRKDRLYVLVEPVGGFPDPDATAGRIAELIQETYYHQRGSITSRLWAAIKLANRDLFEQNTAVSTNERGILGVTCAVLRGVDLYIVQVGPAVAFLWHDGYLERFPATSPWLNPHLPTMLDARLATALGWRRDVEPDLYHGRVDPDDMMVLSSSHLVRLASGEQIAQALAGYSSPETRENLIYLAGGRDLSAIIIKTLAPGAVPASDAALDREQQPIPEPSAEVLNPATMQEKPSPTPEEAADLDDDSRLDLVSAESEWEGPEDIFSAPTDASQTTDIQGESTEVSEVDGLPLSQAVPLPWEDLEAARRRQQGGDFWEGVRRNLSTLGKSLLPEREERSDTPDRDQDKERFPAMPDARFWVIARLVLVALVIPALVVTVFYVNRTREQQAEAEALASQLEAVREKWEAAATGPAETRRTLLYDAQETLDQVLENAPESELAHALGISITNRLEEINKVVRIPYAGELLSFADQDAAPTRLVLRGSDIYLLDPVRSFVDHYTLDGLGEAVLSRMPNRLYPSSVAEADTANAGIIDVAVIHGQVPAGSPSLFMLTKEAVILEYTKQSRDIPAKAVKGDTWQIPQALGTYGTPPGHFLYVLDTAVGRIRKYQAWRNAYSDAPADYPLAGAGISLGQAIDMAIDGSIYVLLDDGAVIKLLQGEVTDFAQTGLDEPFVQPVALTVSQRETMDRGYVFVADAVQERIVQFNKEGQFLQQFKADPGIEAWDELLDIWVDDRAARIYFLNGQSLRYLNVPGS
jgi:hypothetical protein